MAQLDATAVNVALPTIGTDIGGGMSALQWVVDGYVLALASLGMTGGGLGDRYGRRATYRVGLMIFMLGSLGCGIAPELQALIFARIAQGVGASMLMPVTLAIITQTFKDPATRARAIGVWAGTAGIAAAAGPLIGGGLVSAVGWRAIFVVNVPVGLVALVLTSRYVSESRSSDRRPFDLPGQVLWLVTTALLTYTIINAPTVGWLSPVTLTLLGAVMIAGLLLGVVESHARYPLIDIGLYRDRTFTGASVLAILIYLAVTGTLFIGSIQLQQTQGLSPLQTGLRLLATPAALALCSPLAGRLVTRLGNRPLLLAATACLSAATVLLTLLNASSSPLYDTAAYLLLGTGWGLANPLLTDIAITAMPRARAGVASAAVGTSRQLGTALGIAVMGSLIAGHAGHGISSSTAHLGYTAATGATLLGLLIALAHPRSARPPDHHHA